MPAITRRDFLKLGSVASGAAALAGVAPRLAGQRPGAGASQPGIIVFVFDAMTAENLSLYGYRRKTTPNFARFAQRATVFNQHYSAANFTTPGTASLLTGLYPWTHRAINQSGLIARSEVEHSIFHALGESYYRLAFAQNLWPNYFFGQFHRSIDEVLSPAAFSLVNQMVGDLLPHDLANGHRVYDEFLFEEGRTPASLIFGVMERITLRRKAARVSSPDYERGLPRTGYYPIFYTLKDIFDGMLATIERLKPTSFAYLHDWAPHAPYRPSKQFDSLFADRWGPKPKPEHVLGDHVPVKQMDGHRQNYDEYVANVDFEFGRVLDGLEAKGLLDTNYVVVTSDHGEMFERGVEGHNAPILYDPVVRVPLLISSPGQHARQDVRVPTSSTDVLPTLVHLSGGEAPAWCEGQLLPTLGGTEDPERSIFMMNAKFNNAFQPLTRATFAVRKGEYKLLCFRGYSQFDNKDAFELYDISDDPDELNNLYSETSSVAQDLRAELLAKVDEVNARFAAAG
jgi:arylsulfatase A-like enzyme